MDDLTDTFSVFDGAAFQVGEGAALGATLADARAPLCDDVYQFQPSAAAADAIRTDGKLHLGVCGTALHPIRALTFMDDRGGTLRCFQLTSVDMLSFVIPLGMPHQHARYRLIDRADTTLAAFIHETTFGLLDGRAMVKIANGAETPVSRLRPGDRIYSADGGTCVIQHVRPVTSRAVAPDGLVRLRAGTIGNAQDLILHPHQTLTFGTTTTRADQVEDAIHWHPHHALVQIRCDRNAIIYVNGIGVSAHLHDRGPIRPAASHPIHARRKMTHQTA